MGKRLRQARERMRAAIDVSKPGRPKLLQAVGALIGYGARSDPERIVTSAWLDALLLHAREWQLDVAITYVAQRGTWQCQLVTPGGRRWVAEDGDHVVALALATLLAAGVDPYPLYLRDTGSKAGHATGSKAAPGYLPVENPDNCRRQYRVRLGGRAIAVWANNPAGAIAIALGDVEVLAHPGDFVRLAIELLRELPASTGSASGDATGNDTGSLL